MNLSIDSEPQIFIVQIHAILFYRHPVVPSRPTFFELLQTLASYEAALFAWSEEDKAVHPQAAVLGAPLEAGLDLYTELQTSYEEEFTVL